MNHICWRATLKLKSAISEEVDTICSILFYIRTNHLLKIEKKKNFYAHQWDVESLQGQHAMPTPFNLLKNKENEANENSNQP